MDAVQNVAVIHAQNFVHISLARGIVCILRDHLEFSKGCRGFFLKLSSRRHMVTLNFGKDRLLGLGNLDNGFRLSIFANDRVGWWFVSRNV